MIGKMAIDALGHPVLLASKMVEEEVAAPPPPVDHLELARRRDAVREAAREFEPLSEQDLAERFRGTTTRVLSAAELAVLRREVHVQVIDDLVDLLDQSHRGQRRARRTVRISAPRGYTRRTLNLLTQDEVLGVEARLRARGWGDMHVEAALHRRIRSSV